MEVTAGMGTAGLVVAGTWRWQGRRSLVDLRAAADDVAGTRRRLDDVPLGIELAQDLSDDLPDRLQRLEVVLRLVVVLA